MTDIVQVTVVDKQEARYSLSNDILAFDLAYFNGPREGHAYFDSEYLGNGNR